MLGLLAGVVGVVTIAVVYYQRNATQTDPSPKPSTAPFKAKADTPAAAMPVEPGR